MRIEKINGIRYNHDAPSESGEPTRLITEVTYPGEYDGVRGELSRTAWFMNDGNIGSDDWPLEIFPSTLHAPCKDRINFLETLHSYNRPVCCTYQIAAKLVATYGGRLKDYGRLLDCTDTYVWTPDTYDAVLTTPGSAVDEPTTDSAVDEPTRATDEPESLYHVLTYDDDRETWNEHKTYLSKSEAKDVVGDLHPRVAVRIHKVQVFDPDIDIDVFRS